MRPRDLVPRHWFKDGALGQLLRHSGTLIAGDFAANALSVVSLALTARALGAELFGVLVLIQTWSQVVEELVTFQPWKALIRFGAGFVKAEDRTPLQGLLKLGFLLDVGSAAVATALAVGGSFVLADVQGLEDSTQRLLMVFSLGLVASVTGTPTAILRLFDRFKVFSIQKTLSAVVKLVGVGLAVGLDLGLTGFVVVWLVTGVVGKLTLVVFAWRTLRAEGLADFFSAPLYKTGEVFRFSVWTKLITTVSLPLKHFDKAIVGALISVESVGVYRIIKQIALLMTMVSDSVYQVIYPRLAALLAESDLAGALRQARRTGALLLVFTGTVALGVTLFGAPVLRLVFGPSFAQDHLSLSTFMSLRAISCAFVVVHPLFLALGFVKRELAILIVANTLYVGAALYLGGEYGLFGVVLAYGVQFSTVLLSKILVIRSALRERARSATQGAS